MKCIRQIYQPYQKYIIGLMCILVLSTVSQLFIPFLNKKVVDGGLIGRNFPMLLFWISAIFLLQMLDIFLTYVIEKRRIWISREVKTSMETTALQKILNMKISYFDRQNAAGMISRLDVDIEAVSSIFDSGFFSALMQVMSLIGGVIGLSIIEWRLLGIVFSFAAVKYFAVDFLSRKNKTIVKQYIQTCNVFASWYSGIINGIKEIKIYDLKTKIQNEFFEKADEKNLFRQKLDMNGTYKMLLDVFLSNGLNFVLYIAGGYLVYCSSLSVGSVFAFLSYSFYLTNPVSVILNFRYLWSQIEPSITRYEAFLNEEGEMEDGHAVATASDCICMQNLSFGYSEKKIFESAGIVLKCRKVHGVAGQNGSGKTTLIDLLLRFYELQDGRIKWSGCDIRNLELQAYRNLFSVVNQQIYLFNDTVRNNILLDKNISDEEICGLMKECGLGDFLQVHGLDYLLGENGVRLSGGERQKIGIVRAIVQDRPVVLLDEATSNADVFFAGNLEKIIRKFFSDKTVIIITHNLDDFKICDDIVYLSGGEALCYGSYEEFLKEQLPS